MNINSTIMTALNSLTCPVSFQTYNGTVYPHITFFEYNNQGEQWADDDTTEVGHYVQVDIWAKGDYKTLEETVKALMISADFKFTNGQDLYESELKLFHKALRFVYLEEI